MWKHTFPVVDKKKSTKKPHTGKTAVSQNHRGSLYLFCRSHGYSFKNGYPEKKNYSNTELISQHMLTPFWSPQIRPLTACVRIFICLVRFNRVQVVKVSSVQLRIRRHGASVKRMTLRLDQGLELSKITEWLLESVSNLKEGQKSSFTWIRVVAFSWIF